MPTFADPWIETRPDGGRDLSLGDDDIREGKRAWRQRFSVDHDARADESGVTTIGYHKQCTFIETAALPSGTTGMPVLGAETHPVSTKPELCYRDEDNTRIFLTKDGKIDMAYSGNFANIPDTAGNIPEANLGAIIAKLIPTGLIAIWSGLIANIPSGWHLCDGTAGTIDLRDKFVIGAKQDDSGIPKTNVTGSLTQSGGEASHVLTTNEMPAHTHSININSSGTPGTANPAAGTSSASGSGNTVTGSAGGGAAHNTLPPYYSLAFIQKV